MYEHCNCCIDLKCYVVVPTLQVNHCQILLNVQLLEVQNERNLETRIYEGDIIYCCCQGTISNIICSANKNADKLSSCPPNCDVFFNVMLSECQFPSGCLVTSFNEVIIDIPSIFYFGYNVTFILNNVPQQVSRYRLNNVPS